MFGDTISYRNNNNNQQQGTLIHSKSVGGGGGGFGSIRSMPAEALLKRMLFYTCICLFVVLSAHSYVVPSFF